MMELVRNNEEILIILYCFTILWVNVDFLKDYENIQRGLSEISSEDELAINPNSLSLILFGLMFNFFRRWLIYILAIVITGNILVSMISFILFVIGLYDTIYHSRLEKLKNSKMGLYLAGLDTIYISIFIIYLFIARILS